MLRAGVLLPPPEEIGDSTIDVEYVGPLARSQRMEEAVAVERLYQLAMNVAQADPGIMDLIDHDEAIRIRATLLGVPKTILRGRDEVDEMRQMRAQQQQQMMEMQQAQAQAETMKTGAQAAQTMADPQLAEMGEAIAAEMEGLPT